MSTVEKISVALPPEMIAVIRSAVDRGEYSSASEVIREALRGWKLKRKVVAPDTAGRQGAKAGEEPSCSLKLGEF
jgi:hypothetical protein